MWLVVVLTLTFIVTVILTAQWKWANDFVRLYTTQPVRSLQPHFAPHVCLIVCLRGADPFLKTTLRSLLQLSYPSFEIRIVVDHPTDPAFEIVAEVLSEPTPLNVSVQVLEIRQNTSGLKNLALVQAIESSSKECQIFAWIDSDTIPGSTWLWSMVRPFQDPTVAITTGIRWYLPPNNNLGNHLRQIWNAAALLQMQAFGIAWGGSFAIRRSTFEELKLAEVLERSLVEDTLISSEILRNGGRIIFVSEATLPNTETASLNWSLRFITRQLQMVRHYHHSWLLIQILGIVSGLTLTGLSLITIICALRNQMLETSIAFGSLLTFAVVVSYLMSRSEAHVNHALKVRTIYDWRYLLMRLAAAPICQLIHLTAIVQCNLSRNLRWRGIDYRFKAPGQVERLNYTPFRESDNPQHSSI